METVTQTAPDAAAIAAGISKAYSDFIQSEMGRSGYKSTNIYASQWSPCLRYAVLQMTDGDKFPSFPPNTLANFRRGNDRERDLKSDITKIGRNCVPSFELVGMEEKFVLRDKKGRIAISGKVDGRLSFDNVYIDTATKRRLVAPLELKAWHPNLVAGVRSFEDLLENKWMRKGARQLLCYLLATDQPIGFMGLDRPGLPLILPVELSKHLDLAEEFLQMAEKALDHVDAKTLPDFHTEAAECKQCRAFGIVCNPPLKHEGAKFIVDDETLQLIEEHEGTCDAAKMYERAHKKLGELLKPMVAPTATSKEPTKIIAGQFVVDGWRGKNTSLQFPTKEEEKAVKDKYQVSTPDGKFFFEITQVDRD